MKKWIWISLVAVILIGVGVWYFFIRDSGEESTTSATTQTATVTKGELNVNLDSSGTLSVIYDEDVLAEESDTVYKVYVEEGDTVKKGDKLVSFDDSDPIYAPFSGEVTSVNVEADDMVQKKGVLLHLTNYNRLKTVISVDELDITKIKVGQAATVKVGAFEDVTYKGKVTAIAKTGTNENGVASFEVDVTLSSNKNLKPGMSAEATILTASKSDALYVPIEAVQTSNGKKYLVVADSTGENSSAVEVTTGLSNTDYIEITSGVSEGDTVVYALTQSSSSTNGMGGGGMMFRMDGGGPSTIRSGGSNPPSPSGSTGGGN